jgi:hypothetical protein
MLTFDREAGTVCTWDKGRIAAAEMKFIRRMAGRTRLDNKNNLDIMDELSTQTYNKKENYKYN